MSTKITDQPPQPPATSADTNPVHLPPFIPISGLQNFRDIGGYPTTSAPPDVVRKGIFYRSPDLGPITPQGIQQLHGLNIQTILDIRSVPQIVRAGGVKEIEGIKRVWAPVFGEEEYTAERAGLRYEMYSSEGVEGITQAFTEILLHGTKTFHTILTHLATLPSENTPATLIHCTTGNNRSGVFIALLLSYLGVSPSIVAHEYALSQIGLEQGRDVIVERLMKNQKFRERCGDGDEGRRAARRMSGAREESMIAFLQKVEKTWGGVEGLFRDVVGVDETLGRRVKQLMLK